MAPSAIPAVRPPDPCRSFQRTRQELSVGGDAAILPCGKLLVVKRTFENYSRVLSCKLAMRSGIESAG